ncbi:MAG: sigma-54 dependent transcriptional regulator [Candidatus Omnitrophica bacterium]|nr:sigma-54 dependent transcriptional regulator [Candidatus Omnitrophota bacterium]
MRIEQSEIRDGTGFSALILEDEVVCAELLAGAIRDEGGIPVVCGTVAAARQAIAAQPFDLLILDHHLPDGKGGAFFRESREQGNWAAAIMLTGMPDLGIAVELTRSGLFEYITKPFHLEQLIECVRRARLRFPSFRPDRVFMDFVARAPGMRKVRSLVQHAAVNSHATVLLNGETGVGKDVVARMIHQLTFKDKSPIPPLVCLNCSTLPADMFEAELFGAEKGAYTGAHQLRTGLAEAANGGTLFLDEIAEVPLSLQAKLLQFLETQEYRRLGNTESRKFDGRIIAATNKSLQDEVNRGTFRADLLYRLDVFSIVIPPLRERKDDLGELIDLLLTRMAEKYERPKPTIRMDDFLALLNYDYPGNVRELRNLLERSLLQTPLDSNWLDIDLNWPRRLRRTASPPPASPGPARLNPLPPGSLADQERALIQKALEESNGVIRRAAAKLGLTHQSLLRRLKKWPELRQSFSPAIK